jgi:hypothetical protein
MADFSVILIGSVNFFKPLTERAKDFVKTVLKMSREIWAGGSFSLECRFSDALVDYLAENGFMVRMSV